MKLLLLLALALPTAAVATPIRDSSVPARDATKQVVFTTTSFNSAESAFRPTADAEARVNFLRLEDEGFFFVRPVRIISCRTVSSFPVCAPIQQSTPVSSLPEPSTWTLFGSGLIGLAGLVRRRTARAS